jgi:hypothetical protein
MRFFTRIAALAALSIGVAGCAEPISRTSVLDELNPAPMSPRAWSQVVGTYLGPIHASTERGSFEGLTAIETRLDISGPPDSPDVIVRLDRGYSTSWTAYGEWHGTFTNITERRYGSQGAVIASTHAPNQMLLKLRRNRTTSPAGAWMILTFLGNGRVDVDWIGRSGWRGTGELWRDSPVLTPQ